MTPLRRFNTLDIDWEMTPEDAVATYLEWGNNNWRSSPAPVRSVFDESVYFVVDAWEDIPVIRLIRRNREAADELAAIRLTPEQCAAWREAHGNLKGVFAPTEELKAWLKELL